MIRVLIVGALNRPDHELRTEIIKKAFSHPEIEYLSTELEFREKVPAICEKPPDLIFFSDRMIWTYPSPHIVGPDFDWEKEGGATRAGFRSEALLRSLVLEVPVIIGSWDVNESDVQDDIAKLSPDSHYLMLDESETAFAIRRIIGQ